MKNSSSLVYNFFLIIGDLLALVLAFVGAYILRVTISHEPVAYPVQAKTYLIVFLALLPFWIIIFALLGLYNSNIYEKRFPELGRLFTGSFIGLLFVIGYDFFSTKPILPARLVPIYGFILGFVFLVLLRNIARLVRTMLFAYEKGLTNVLIIGNTKIAEELVDSLQDSRHSGYRIVGVVGDKTHNAHKYPHITVFGTFAEAYKKLGAGRIHSIVQTELYADEPKNQEILEFAQTHHIGYRFTPGNSELFVGNIDVELFRSSVPVIAVHQTALFGWGRVVKRLFDLSVGLIALIIASPIMLIVAVANLLSGKSVFFRQTRLTRYDQEFKLIKFQTLKNTYNGLSPEDGFTKMGKPELIKRYRENGDYLADDPRYGRFGRLLYKTSLDELPQLINVVKGDISLVGPRALIPQELSVYGKRHAILSVKSGLTGLAQVSGRRDISFDERRQLDVYYVQKWSFWLDIVILLKTIRAVLSGSGAK
jgi:exopolysaccharide biosynthesis polyprenyl glycosylphosphotransferase